MHGMNASWLSPNAVTGKCPCSHVCSARAPPGSPWTLARYLVTAQVYSTQYCLVSPRVQMDDL